MKKNNKTKYNSPFVRIFTNNSRRKKGLLEPPVLPTVSQNEKTNSEKEFYSEEDWYEGGLAKITGSLLGFLFVLMGILCSTSPQSKFVHPTLGEIKPSLTSDIISTVFLVIIGFSLLWVFFFRHFFKNKNS